MSVKQNRKLPILITLLLIALVIAGSFFYDRAHKDDPSTRQASLAEMYPVKEGTIPLVINGTMSEVRGVWKNHQVYLRLGTIVNEVNPRFYWDDNEQLLIYTGATQIVRAYADTQYENAPVFYDTASTESSGDEDPETRIYVSLGYVCQYTNIELDVYNEPLRAFIRSRYGEYRTAVSGENAVLRTKPAYKSDMIVQVPAGRPLWIISSKDGWNRAYAGGETGHVGYISDAELEDVKTVYDEGPNVQEPYTRLALDGRVCMVWHQVFSESGVDSIDGLLDSTSGVNVVAPTWFSVADSDGNLSIRANSEYVEKVHARGMQVWALIENINTPGKLDYRTLLGKSSVRAKMIDTVMAAVRDYNIDGVNVDLEGLPAEAGDGYLAFMRELSVACRRAGKVLSVCNYVPSAWTEHYHRDLLGEFVDYMMIMAYDEHYNGSDAGSTASLPFVKKGLADTLALGVPAEKLVCGLPFYSRVWRGEGTEITSETINMRAMKELMDTKGVTVTWEEEDAQYFAEREVDGVLNRVWIEDESSMAKKLEAVNELGISGVSFWRLGMEAPEVWTPISEYLAR